MLAVHRLDQFVCCSMKAHGTDLQSVVHSCQAGAAFADKHDARLELQEPYRHGFHGNRLKTSFVEVHIRTAHTA